MISGEPGQLSRPAPSRDACFWGLHSWLVVGVCVVRLLAFALLMAVDCFFVQACVCLCWLCNAGRAAMGSPAFTPRAFAPCGPGFV